MSVFVVQNVHRVERTISITTGLAAIVCGIHQGGTPGLFKALGGAALLQRGLSGHCVVKGLITDPETELESLRQRVAELRAALPRIEEHAAARKRAQEERLDHAVEETFPASDPISP